MTFKKAFDIMNAFVEEKPNNRGVAQLVARMVRDHEVVGSNPVASTKNRHLCKKNVHKCLIFCMFV